MCLREHLNQPDAPKLVLVMDECDALVDKETGSTARLVEFLQMVGDLKQACDGTVGCLLIGTDELVHPIHKVAMGNTSAISTFTSARRLSLQRFTQDDVTQLVEQLCDEREDAGAQRCTGTGEIAASVMVLTAGHRGLVGQCLRWIEQRLRSGQPVTACWWIEEASSQMPDVLFSVGNVTSHRIALNLKKTQDDPAMQEVIQEVMTTGYHDTGRKPVPVLSTGEPVNDKLMRMGGLDQTTRRRSAPHCLRRFWPVAHPAGDQQAARKQASERSGSATAELKGHGILLLDANWFVISMQAMWDSPAHTHDVS